MLPQIHHVVDKVTPTVALSPEAEESTYMIAKFLMKITNFLLDLIGQGNNQTLFEWVYAILVFVCAFIIGSLLQWGLVFLSKKISKHIDSDIYNFLQSRKFFSRAFRIVPALLFLVLIEFTLTYKVTLSTWLTRLTWIYITLIVAWTLNQIVKTIWYRIDTRENKKKLPLKGLVQIINVFVWCVAIIIILAILVNKSPGALLAGLGAFAAVLMLIFKDSILGLVAGVQLSENDSLHVGDWIKVSGTDANGIVTEVSLSEVKVENFDKTVTSLPPYSLISGHFTNMKNMSDSNTRRIQRSINIDADSVMHTDDSMLAEFQKLPLIGDWIKQKIQQRQEGKGEETGLDNLVNGSIETNLGIFRAYVTLYLNQHPQVYHVPGGMNYVFATILPPQASTGIPLQFYCFTNTSNWIEYMGIQDEITEHLLVMLPKFHLYLFESESGRDSIIEGYMSQVKDPESLYGVPYPFYSKEITVPNPANASTGLTTSSQSDNSDQQK